MMLVSHRLTVPFSLFVSVLTLYPSVVQSAETLSVDTCKALNVSEVTACDALCTETSTTRTIFGGLSDFGWFCQCNGQGVCSDYSVKKCSERNVIDADTCKIYCEVVLGFPPAEYSNETSPTGTVKSDCSCGQFEFCTDTFFPDEVVVDPTTNGTSSTSAPDSGGTNGTDPTTGTSPPVGPSGPSCLPLGVNPGTTTSDCRTLCGSQLAKATDTNVFPSSNASGVDQKIYRLTRCECSGELKCEDNKLIVDMDKTFNCGAVGVTDTETCGTRCFPQGFQFMFDSGAFTCLCEVGDQKLEACQQLAPSGAGSMMMSSSSWRIWSMTAAAAFAGIMWL